MDHNANLHYMHIQLRTFALQVLYTLVDLPQYFSVQNLSSVSIALPNYEAVV